MRMSVAPQASLRGPAHCFIFEAFYVSDNFVLVLLKSSLSSVFKEIGLCYLIKIGIGISGNCGLLVVCSFDLMLIGRWDKKP